MGDADDIRTVAVVGAGNMGSGIAVLLSQVGECNVTLTDTADEILTTRIQRQRDSIQKHFVDKSKMSAEDMELIFSRIQTTTDLQAAVREADLVIEAVFENMELKKTIFEQIDDAATPHAILATNTSYLSVTEIANSTKTPDRVAGMHFFNPVAVMKLVEVVRAALTSEETASTVHALAQRLGKEPVYCRDVYGFLANRAVLSRNDAVELLWAHVAPPEDIDKAVRLGYNRPLGPLESGDMTGAWSIAVHSEEDRIREFGWERGHTHPLIKMMVRAGYIGGHGNKGIYDFWRDVLSTW
jgi:3-hydroxybutyryl-CoA dehydrogenase